MDVFANLAQGFSTALAPMPLLFCLLGVTLGTLVGVLPGLGSMAALSLLLPFTFHLDPTSALVMLAGMYYGAQYGGSTASILLNLPGTAAAAVTCLDGYPMSRAGRSGVALFITSIASFVGGVFAICLLIAFAPFLAGVALSFGPWEYFSIILLGLVSASTLAAGSPVKGAAAVALGLLLGCVGADIESGTLRFTLGFTELFDGVNMIALAMGLFGISEILGNVGNQPPRLEARGITWNSLLPTRKEWRQSLSPMGRGSVIGALFGILPGAGGAIATLVSYGVEKRVAKDPSRFGKGAVEGIASPEAANNSSVQAAFIPTLTLGIPGDATMAIILSALLIQGIIPGPQLVGEHPDLFWALVASFFIGNLLLIVLNIPLIGVWVRILSIPYTVLYPSILFFICIGVYSVNNSAFDVMLVGVFGALGYAMSLYGFPAAPLLLGFILGPLVEEHLRRAFLIGDGDPLVFFQRPISATFLGLTLALVAFGLLVKWRRWAVRARRDPVD